MKLQHLRCLCAIAQHGFSISRAAGALETSQPAISKQIRLLETELGADLLIRRGNRITGLTAVGEAIIEAARRTGLAREATGSTITPRHAPIAAAPNLIISEFQYFVMIKLPYCMSCALEQAAGDAAWASLIDRVEREIAKPPTFLVYGPFDRLAIDPPWPMQKIQCDAGSNQAAAPATAALEGGWCRAPNRGL